VVGDILQPTHLLFVLVIALLVLGPKRLPEVGRSLGRGLRDFRTALGGEDDQSGGFMSQATVEAPPVPAQPAQAAEVSEPPLAAAAAATSEPADSAG
jgi:sec-independent protein translocase protein TatA